MLKLDCKESWVLKNWCFWTVVLEKTLESPLDCKEIQPVHSEGDQPWDSLEGLMLKLKLQYFAHVMWRADSLEKTLMLGKIGGRGEGDNRGWDGWMASPNQWTWVRVDSRSWWWTERPGVLWFMWSQRLGHDWATDLNWTEQKSFWQKCHSKLLIVWHSNFCVLLRAFGYNIPWVFGCFYNLVNLFL